MAGQTSINVTIGILVLSLGGAAWFMLKKAKANKEAMMAESAPKVAGDDTLEGGAKDPEKFDEPDDDALDEMGDLLGLDDEEEDQIRLNPSSSSSNGITSSSMVKILRASSLGLPNFQVSNPASDSTFSPLIRYSESPDASA